jgi:GNAT superfamily N-acetyltransferase
VSESTISVRRASADSISSVVELAGTALGWDPSEPNEALFRWKHLDNPTGPSPMWLAYAGDTLAGFRAMMQWEFLHDRRTRIRAVRAVDTATHPEFRRRGIFRTLTMAAVEELTSDGVDFVFNTPNPASRAGYLTMGWQDVGRIPMRFFPGRISGPLRTIRAKVPARKWSEPCSAGDTVDSVADELAGQSHWPDRRGLTTSHTGEYLRWRYGFEPLHYRVIRTDDASAIVRVRRRGPATEVVVAELLATSRRRAEAVLRKVRSLIDTDHVLVAASGLAPLPPMLPLPRSGPALVVRSLASHAPARSELLLSLGDVELF